MSSAIPAGFHTITPHMIVRDVAKALAFYKNVFGAETESLHFMPDGKTVMHAKMRIGDSSVLMAEENPQWGTHSPLSLGNTPVSLHLYVKDVDATFNQAVAAGAKPAMPPDGHVLGRPLRQGDRSVRPSLEHRHAHQRHDGRRGRQGGAGVFRKDGGGPGQVIVFPSPQASLRACGVRPAWVPRRLADSPAGLET